MHASHRQQHVNAQLRAQKHKHGITWDATWQIMNKQIVPGHNRQVGVAK